MGETVEPHSILHLPADIAHDLRRPLGVFREHHELLLDGIRDVQFVLRAEVVVIVVTVFRCDLKTRRVNWVMEKFYPKHTATTRVLRTRGVCTVDGPFWVCIIQMHLKHDTKRACEAHSKLV